MKRYVIRLAALAATVVLAGTARATELETLEHKVGKYAPVFYPELQKKGVCVCQDGSAQHGQAGFLHQSTMGNGGSTRYVYAYCTVRTYDTQGIPTTSDLCTDFIPLAR